MTAEDFLSVHGLGVWSERRGGIREFIFVHERQREHLLVELQPMFQLNLPLCGTNLSLIRSH